jgi:hypothetical protein
MEQRPFKSGDQTPGGAMQDFLVSLSAGLVLFGFELQHHSTSQASGRAHRRLRIKS